MCLLGCRGVQASPREKKEPWKKMNEGKIMPLLTTSAEFVPCHWSVLLLLVLPLFHHRHRIPCPFIGFTCSTYSSANELTGPRCSVQRRGRWGTATVEPVRKMSGRDRVTVDEVHNPWREENELSSTTLGCTPPPRALRLVFCRLGGALLRPADCDGDEWDCAVGGRS